MGGYLRRWDGGIGSHALNFARCWNGRRMFHGDYAIWCKLRATSSDVSYATGILNSELRARLLQHPYVSIQIALISTSCLYLVLPTLAYSYRPSLIYYRYE